jgi:hypothetical protein
MDNLPLGERREIGPPEREETPERRERRRASVRIVGSGVFVVRLIPQYTKRIGRVMS